MSKFVVWAVYDHPKDYPDHYVARQWEVETFPGLVFPKYKETPTDEIFLDERLSAIEAALNNLGFVKIGRHLGDDPVIISTWV